MLGSGGTTSGSRRRLRSRHLGAGCIGEQLGREFMAAKIGKIAFPPGLFVSIVSVNDLNPMPRRSNSCTVSTRWPSDLDNL
jgi:hypothetical protein